MTEAATLSFFAEDGRALCNLTLIAQGRFEALGRISPIQELDAATAADAGEASVQLLEGCRYEYALSSGFELQLALYYSDTQGIVIPSKLEGRAHCGVLNPGLATGQLPLVVTNANGEIGRASVEVRSRKLNYKSDYQQMLSEITEQCVELLQDIRSPSAFNAIPDPGNDPKTIGQRFAFVRALLQSPEFDNVLNRIVTHPHQIWEREEYEHQISRGFKPSGKLMRQLVKGGRRLEVSSARPFKFTLNTLPEHITAARAVLTTDTPENRFVKFALRGFHQFLMQMRQTPALDPAKDSRLLSELDSLCVRLDEALSADVLRLAGEPSFLPLGSPTLQRREGYREVFQAWSHFAMAAKLVWEGGEKVYGAGQRDVATLYEYWVFFALLQIVAKVFKLEAKDKRDLIEDTGDGFGLKLKAGRHIPLRGQSFQPGRNLEVKFSYNRSFRATRKPHQAGSWTNNLRPDYTLSLWPVGFSEEEAEMQELIVHVHFDAKYRLEQVAEFLGQPSDSELTEEELGDELDTEKQEESRGTYKRADLLKMHAYRDAIRRSQGAYVIYPGESGDSKQLQGFHEVLPGLGAFALSPGSGTDALVEFLNDVVDHVADRSTAREQNSFHTYQAYKAAPPIIAAEQRALYSVLPEKIHGSANRQTPPRETFVVVGWVKSKAHLQWITDAGKYNFRMGNTPGALRLSPQVAGATYLLLHSDNDKAEPGLFRISKPELGPQVLTAAELRGLKYPSEPSQTSYLVFDVERALEFDDYEWNYISLANKPAKARHGYPFATNLYELLQVCVPKLK